MSVAPSYQKYSIIGNPYTKNDKEYILIDFHGRQKEVRWYREYRRIRPLKDVLGFSKGFIYLFQGPAADFDFWFRQRNFVYREYWGWALTSDEPLPDDIPYGLTPVKLPWEKVVSPQDPNKLRPFDEIKLEANKLLYPQSSSIWLGSPGERLILELTLLRAIPLSDNNWGPQTFYLFSDASGNIASWTTVPKPLSVGQTYTLTVTIKACEIYKNEKQTRLTNCRVK